MACMGHECIECGRWWSNNEPSGECPDCGSLNVQSTFDEAPVGWSRGCGDWEYDDDGYDREEELHG